METLQPQQTRPGTLFAQGVVGGAIGGYVYILLMTLWQVDGALWMVLSATPLCMVLGTIVGVIEATAVRALYLLAGIQMRAAMRVSVASVVASLSVGVIGIQYKGPENDLTVWLIMALSFSVPPALMIDSDIRLSKLFTSGSDAVAGGLPLRFLSFGATALWILLLAQQARQPLFSAVAILGWLPLLYMGISAFLTFTSPPRLLLLILGIGGNVPVVLCSWVFFSEYFFFYGPDWLLIPVAICWAFLISWAIFLIARLSVAKLSETARFT